MSHPARAHIRSGESRWPAAIATLVAIGPADFRFPQDEDHDAIDEVRKGSSAVSGWMAVYVDYLYVSLTNSSAFSPTDTMPLTSRAKLLMGAQSAMALITSVVVIAKGVGSLQ